MTSPSEQRRVERLERCAVLLLLGVMAVGALVVLGWLLAYDPLVRLVPGGSRMSLVTAVCFILVAAALQARIGPRAHTASRLRLARVLAGLVLLFAAGAVVGPLVGVDLDAGARLAAQFTPLGMPAPPRMQFMTGIVFAAIAGAVLLLDTRWPRGFMPSQALALVVGGFGLLAFEGFLFGYSSVAVHSALAVLALGFALLLARPRVGLMAEVFHDGSGAVLARRVLPFIFVMPIAIAWLRLMGERAGWYGLEIGLALVATSNICLLGLVVYLAVRSINRSERKLEEARQQFVQAQKMEAIGRLAGGIAHDFNNLLMVIKGNAELLQGSLAPQDLLRSEVEDIRAAADRAQSLTQQLLAFSRKQVLTPRVIDVNEVVRGVTRMLQRLIGEHIAVRVALTEQPATVRADPHQLEQVLMNLAVNARDAMPSGGRLTVRTSRLRRAQWPRPGEEAVGGPVEVVRIEIVDDGQGMDEVTRSRVFEPFFTTKGVGHGTGLGLSTVYGIVTQSEGAIAVQSTPGVGTTFTIDLPFVVGEVEAVTGRAPAAARSRTTARILLVEDEPTVRRVVQQLLESAGHRVLVASDGEDALRAFAAAEGVIDLLITDVVMPRLGGAALAERLRKQAPELRVLFMSGYTDDAVRNQSLGLAGAEFVNKPFERETLLLKVRRLLER